MPGDELADQIDWDDVNQQATDLFRTLLRIDTTNSDGVQPNETAAAKAVADFLESEGIGAQVLESKPGKGNVVARLSGNGTGGAAIMSSGHLDVVPATAADWDHPPFAAEIHDGAIWGRGAIDCKNMIAMQTMVAVLLRRLGVTLSRDFIIAGVADEEAGCTWGSMWLVENHPELITAEYVLSEAGGYSTYIGDKTFWPIQIAEKGVVWLTIRATGTSGHGSDPNHDNPIAAIGRAAAALGTTRLPYHLTPVTKGFISTIADQVGLPDSVAMRGLLTGLTSSFTLDHIFPNPDLASTFDAVLHNTANPTMLLAGDKINQVPGEAIMRVDGRTLPGQSAPDLVSEIRTVIGEGFEITVDLEMPPVIGDPDNPVMTQIRKVLARHDPQGVVLPYLLPAFTDAKAYSRLGSTVMGFTPIQLPQDLSFTKMFHGVNERIPVAGFHFGVRTLFEVIAGLVVE